MEYWENVHDSDFHLWVSSLNFNLHVSVCMTVKKLCLFCDFPYAVKLFLEEISNFVKELMDFVFRVELKKIRLNNGS